MEAASSSTDGGVAALLLQALLGAPRSASAVATERVLVANGIPTVPKSLLARIRRGEYVECTGIADALEWVVRSRGVRSIFHYIDDFIFIGAPQSDECVHSLRLFLSTSEALGMLVSSDKTEGPARRLTVLGIQIDTVAMTLSLPEEKLERIGSLLQEWHGRRAGTRRELESLVGTLQHAACVVRPGRLFLRRIYDLLAGTSHFQPHHFICLNAESRADIEWWYVFHRFWNGVAIIRNPDAFTPDVVLCTDASGSWGCGAFWRTLWFQVPWHGLAIAGQSIAAKELFPIVLASLL